MPITVIKKLRRDCATKCHTHYHFCVDHNPQIIKTEKAEHQGDDKGTLPNKTIQHEISDRNLCTCVKCSSKQRDLRIRWNGKLKVSSISHTLSL